MDFLKIDIEMSFKYIKGQTTYCFTVIFMTKNIEMKFIKDAGKCTVSNLWLTNVIKSMMFEFLSLSMVGDLSGQHLAVIYITSKIRTLSFKVKLLTETMFHSSQVIY